jgi:hypothetical protein
MRSPSPIPAPTSGSARLKLSPERSRDLSEALRAVTHAAHAAEQAPDTGEAKRRLTALWSAVHDAYSALNHAEREVRAEAIRKIEGKAA